MERFHLFSHLSEKRIEGEQKWLIAVLFCRFELPSLCVFKHTTSVFLNTRHYVFNLKLANIRFVIFNLSSTQ